MAKIKRYTTADGDYHGELAFFCPGCNCRHYINDSQTNISNVPVWEFNGDFNKPTVKPSILTRMFMFNEKTGKFDKETERCHSNIRDGKIQFLSDCQHALAGQTVELLEI